MRGGGILRLQATRRRYIIAPGGCMGKTHVMRKYARIPNTNRRHPLPAPRRFGLPRSRSKLGRDIWVACRAYLSGSPRIRKVELPTCFRFARKYIPRRQKGDCEPSHPPSLFGFEVGAGASRLSVPNLVYIAIHRRRF